MCACACALRLACGASASLHPAATSPSHILTPPALPPPPAPPAPPPPCPPGLAARCHMQPAAPRAIPCRGPAAALQQGARVQVECTEEGGAGYSRRRQDGGGPAQQQRQQHHWPPHVPAESTFSRYLQGERRRIGCPPHHRQLFSQTCREAPLLLSAPARLGRQRKAHAPLAGRAVGCRRGGGRVDGWVRRGVLRRS